jgi:4-diphosphocytidyl-2-C-methyl-D-erythritol kinase
MLYDIPAPAKLNLFLHVVGRRPDGYHLLQTVFRFIDLADSIDIDMRQDGQIQRETDMVGVAHDDDLVVRAARALQHATGCTKGAQIRVRKRIPAGGGLGGGSSDAASVLLALNKLWQTGLSRQALMQLGLMLGADVPVFIFGQNAFAEGVGEDLQALELPDRAYIVIQPAQNVPTLGVFQDPDLTRNTDPVKIMDFSGMSLISSTENVLGCSSNSTELGSTALNSAAVSTTAVSSTALKSTAEQSRVRFHNDLQPVVLKNYPIVQQAYEWCVQAGLDVRMTGSGACLFAEFAQIQLANLAHDKMLAKMHADFSESLIVGVPSFIQSVSVCNGLSEHPLRSWI